MQKTVLILSSSSWVTETHVGSEQNKKRKPGHGTFLSELLSFAEQAVEDGTEVGEKPLAVLQQLQGLRICEVGRAVEQRRTCTTDNTTA